MSSHRLKVIIRVTAGWLIVVGLWFGASPALAGSLLEKISEHLAAHYGAKKAEQLIEYLTRGDKTPVLQSSDAALDQIINDKIADCVRRARQLDEQDPQLRALQGKPPALIGPAYAAERAAFAQDCRSVLPDRAN